MKYDFLKIFATLKEKGYALHSIGSLIEWSWFLFKMLWYTFRCSWGMVGLAIACQLDKNWQDKEIRKFYILLFSCLALGVFCSTVLLLLVWQSQVKIFMERLWYAQKEITDKLKHTQWSLKSLNRNLCWVQDKKKKISNLKCTGV